MTKKEECKKNDLQFECFVAFFLIKNKLIKEKLFQLKGKAFELPVKLESHCKKFKI